MKRFLLLSLWLSACSISIAPAGRGASASDIFKVRPEPKVERYDWERDDFIRRESVLTRGRARKPRYSLSNNRLHRFRFLGPPEQSGIYGAIEDYHRERKLDPAKYE